MGKHKQYDVTLKTQVVLEVLKGQKSLAQICREYEVGADLVCHWRDMFLERAPQAFADPRSNGGLRPKNMRRSQNSNEWSVSS